MQNLYSRLVNRSLYRMIFVGFGCMVLIIFLMSCSASIPVQQKSLRVENDTLAVRYSILFIIHGDGNYLYHDTSGNEHIADEEVLASAKIVAEKNPSAEVFIFHQKPRSHFYSFSHFGMENSIITGTDSSSQMSYIGAIRN